MFHQICVHMHEVTWDSKSLKFSNVNTNYVLLPIQDCKHSNIYFPGAKIWVAFNRMDVKQIENTSKYLKFYRSSSLQYFANQSMQQCCTTLIANLRKMLLAQKNWNSRWGDSWYFINNVLLVALKLFQMKLKSLV